MLPVTDSAQLPFRCLMCGNPVSREPDLCSTHCRAEADLELRSNRARIIELRRGRNLGQQGNREIRGIFDRNAELLHALIDSASPVRPYASTS